MNSKRKNEEQQEHSKRTKRVIPNDTVATEEGTVYIMIDILYN